jgi:hypothetical protein
MVQIDWNQPAIRRIYLGFAEKEREADKPKSDYCDRTISHVSDRIINPVCDRTNFQRRLGEDAPRILSFTNNLFCVVTQHNILG